MPTNCPTCGYAHSGADCDNPGCVANPAVSDTQKAIWADAKARSDAERNERMRFAEIRRRAMGGK